jgi:hypothetical protein
MQPPEFPDSAASGSITGVCSMLLIFSEKRKAAAAVDPIGHTPNRLKRDYGSQYTYIRIRD